MVFYLLLALFVGLLNVVNKMVNFRATQILGTWNGSLVNYLVATILSAGLFFALGGVEAPELLPRLPWYQYLGGTFGVAAFVLMLVCLSRMDVFRSTALLLVGQLLMGIVMDLMLQKPLTAAKLAGIALVTVGILWDKKLPKAQ